LSVREIPPFEFWISNLVVINIYKTQCMMVSLAGVAASQKVTEAYEGRLMIT